MPTILAVDDDRLVLELIEHSLSPEEYRLITAGNSADAIKQIQEYEPDVVLLDVHLPDLSGIETVDKIKNIDSRLPIIFMTVSESSEIAIEAVQKGAYEFLTKPLHVETIRDVVGQALATRLMQNPVSVLAEKAIKPQLPSGDVMIGTSPAMLEVYKDIGRIADKDVPVLICGESGTGKELVARSVFQHSTRRDGPFLAVNCAAISETLLESELFGHEKGAFTGADQLRVGKFEQCCGGTIFLDEVGDMSPTLQSKLLRLLQEQNFQRVGGQETIQTNVRIISATNRDFEKMIENESFRLDLYHRLNGFRIDLPPLRERHEDLPILVQHFASTIARDLELEPRGISPAAMEKLQSYSWPGNIRELQGAIRKALLISNSPVLLPEDFPDEDFQPGNKNDGTDSRHMGSNRLSGSTPLEATRSTNETDLSGFVEAKIADGSNNLYEETQMYMERFLIVRVLKEYQGNQSKTAEMLGISRGRLRTRLRALGISIEQVIEM